MSVPVSNTELSHSFNTWRLNTNFISTIISNNAVTVWRGGDANRGGAVAGNGHVSGTFSATELRANTLRGGNTTFDDRLTVTSNAHFIGTSLHVQANTEFHGNVNFTTAGTDRIIMGDISRIRVTGGTQGQFLRIAGATDTPEFKSLTLRDITDLSSNSAPITLSGANTVYSNNNDSPALIFTNGGSDRASMYLAASTFGDSDLHVKLVDAVGDSKFVITDSANTIVGTIDSNGKADFSSSVNSVGVVSSGDILPLTDDAVDLGSPTQEFKDAYIDGTAFVDVLSLGIAASQGVDTAMIPTTTGAKNLGSGSRMWNNVWSSGTLNGSIGKFGGNLSVNGTFVANGNITLGSDSLDVITVKGNFANVYVSGTSRHSTITVDGASTLTGAVGVGSTLGVTGASTLSSLHATAAVDFDTTLNVDGVATVNGLHSLAGGDFDTTLNVDGATTLNGAVTLGDASTDVITVKGNFANQHTTGIATFNGNMTLGNAPTDVLTIKGSFANQHTTGTSTFTKVGVGKQVTAGWDVELKNSLLVGQNLQVGGNTHITGGLTVDGTFAIPQNTIIAVADATFDDLTVTGGTTLGTSSLDLTTITGTLAHSGGPITQGGTVIIGDNGSIHANNAISAGSITTTMLSGSAFTIRDGAAGTTDAIGFGETLQVTEGAGIDVTVAPNNLTVSVQNSGVAAATYGSATAIPEITVNAQGQVTSVVNRSVSGVSDMIYSQANNNIRVATASGLTFDDTIEPAGTTAGTTRGVASFNSVDFNVSAGHVSLNASGAVTTVNGTANEVEVSRVDGTVTLGLPTDVTVAGQLNVGENIVISGNLVVNGTTTTIEAETVRLADNIIVLNSNHTGTPTQDAGFSVERGSLPDKDLLWVEATDRWSVGADTMQAGTFIGNLTGDVTGNVSGNVTGNLTGDVTGNASTASVAPAGTLTGTTLAAGVTQSSLTKVGTISTGVWSGTALVASKVPNHDSLTGFVANEHINHSSVSVIAGTGLSGGGTIAASRTLNLDFAELTDMTADISGTTQLILQNGTVESRKAANEIKLSAFNNDITPAASTTVAGIVELANTTETNAGTDVTRAVTPNGLNVWTGGSGAITKLGTIASGVWNGTTIAVANGGTGVTTSTGTGSVVLSASPTFTGTVSAAAITASGAVATGNLTTTGFITATGDISSTSDARVKDNINTITNALEKVMHIEGVNFTRTDQEDKEKVHVGVIAQNVEEVLPEVIHTNEEGMKSVNYGAMVGLLIEAIKEQQIEIDMLKRGIS